MSGGHFDYAYSRVDQFADQLELDLREPKEWNAFRLETYARLQEILNQARQLASDMKEVEWLFSGDTGEDTFLIMTRR